MVLRGSGVLSEDAAKALASEFDWKPTLRDDIPTNLRKDVPPGDLLVSAKFNQSFTANPTYTHGFVVTLVDDHWKRFYFVATDMDHPIQAK